MIAVGIPSFNEADNIRQLVEAIDVAASALGEPLLIINADNASEDRTAEIFRLTRTKNKKVSLTTTGRGKGRNIKCIIDYIIENDIRYCFFIDGDMTSMEPDWLKKQLREADRGTDYVVPNYARYMQEGNATNHFFFPVLHYFSKGRAPYQPIAGDFGISARFAKYIQRLPWQQSTQGYGVDIFMTMHALFGGFNVVEISLDKKIHKPSYGKMITIFEESATSYFAVRKALNISHDMHFTRETSKPLTLLPGDPPPSSEIAERMRYAQSLLVKQSNNSIGTWQHLCNTQTRGLDAATWAQILVEHEKHIHCNNATKLARSLTPFYLLRVIAYLRDATTPTQAEQMLASQTALIAEKYAQADL